MQIKLVLVYPTDPNIEIMGGGTRYVRYLLNQSIKNGIKVKFVGVKLGDYPHVAIKGYEFFPILKGRNTWWLYLLVSFIKVPFLEIEPTAIIHTQRLIYLLPYIIFFPRNPKVCTSDEPMVAASKRYPKIVFFFLSRLFSILERFIIKKIDAIIASERVLKEYYERRYPQFKKKLRYNVNPAAGVNLKRFVLLDKAQCRRNLGYPLDEKIWIYVGRLAPVKRVDFLIKAYVEFTKMFKKSRFLIVGRGESERNLKDLASRYKHKIEFLGEMRGQRLIQLYNCADVFVFASISEGNPTAVREALACGVPVVSTNVGDVRYIIKDREIGCVLPINATPQEFAKAVYKLIKKEEGQIRFRCREYSLLFSEENTFPGTLDLYKELSRKAIWMKVEN